METACPYCGKKYKVSDGAVGKQARCGNPECQKTFVVGAAAEGQAAAGAEPGAARPRPVATPLTSSGAAPAAPAPPPIPAAGPPPLSAADPWSGSAGPQGGGIPALDSLLSAQVAPGPPGAPPMMPGMPMARTARRRGSPKGLILGIVGAVAVVAVIVGVYFLITMISGGGKASVPGWAASYVMDGAKGIGYANVEKLRKSEAFALVKKLASGGGGMPGMDGLPFDLSALDKIAEVFVVVKSEDDALVVVRTHEDMSLDQVVGLIQESHRPRPSLGPKFQPSFGPKPKTPPAGAGPTKKAGNIEYVSVPDACLAKIESKTYCIAPKEEALKQLSDRLAKKAGGQLDKRLQDIMKHASGDHYFVMVDLNKMGPRGGMGGPADMLPGTPEWVAFGLSASSSIAIQGAAGFSKTSDAEKIKKDYDTAMAEMNSQMKQFDQLSAKLPPEVAKQARQQMDKAMSLIRGLQLSQSGNTLRVSGKWRVKDIEEFIDGIKGMMGGMRGSPF